MIPAAEPNLYTQCFQQVHKNVGFTLKGDTFLSVVQLAYVILCAV